MSQPYRLGKYVVLWLLLLLGIALKFEICLFIGAVSVPDQTVQYYFKRQEYLKVNNRKCNCYAIIYVTVFAGIKLLKISEITSTLLLEKWTTAVKFITAMISLLYFTI